MLRSAGGRTQTHRASSVSERLSEVRRCLRGQRSGLRASSASSTSPAAPDRRHPASIATVPGWYPPSRLSAQICGATLWLYAENDSFFGPELVGRMHRAFTAGGGKAELRIFGALDPDGHDLFARFDGRLLWLPELDRFLRTQQLPTWDSAPLTALAGQLAPEPQRVLARFLSAPTEKAIALSRSGRLARWWGGEGSLGSRTPEEPRSVRACRRRAMRRLGREFQPR